MELILWRHAEAEEGGPDLDRKLTSTGHRDAARVAKWLQRRLPSKFTVICSPAQRARETADALEARYKISDRLAPGAAPGDVLDACGWPSHNGAVVVVGHQPDLGRVAALLVSGAEGEWSVKKGALWWLSNRDRDSESQVVVRAVLAPEFL